MVQLSNDELIALGKEIWDMIHTWLDNDSDWHFCEETSDVKMYKYVQEQSLFQRCRLTTMPNIAFSAFDTFIVASHLFDSLIHLLFYLLIAFLPGSTLTFA